MLIDTAGIRKKNKVSEDLEFYSVMRAINALDEADVVILVLDATLGLEAQDMNILGLAQKRHKGILILVNKWDLVENKQTNTVRDYEARIREKTAPFTDVKILFISALEKTRIFQAIEAAQTVYENRSRRIKTSELNEVLQEALEQRPPPSVKGRFGKIKYVTQLPMPWPAFAFFVNNPNYIREDYRNYLENVFRKKFDFTGVPIEMYMRQK